MALEVAGVCFEVVSGPAVANKSIMKSFAPVIHDCGVDAPIPSVETVALLPLPLILMLLTLLFDLDGKRQFDVFISRLPFCVCAKLCSILLNDSCDSLTSFSVITLLG